MSTVIEVKNLSFRYERNYILKNIGFSIQSGEYIGIVGGNGSGKSTLLNLIIGKLNPSTGNIVLYEKKFGYLSQQVRNFNNKFPATVEEVIAANLYSEMGILKRLRRHHKLKIKEVLKLVDMEKYRKRLIGNLSGGQQQRIFLARLLVNNPRIIFMDEPIVGLDDESIIAFYNLMDRLNNELGLSIVMVTHDIKAMEKRADKIILLDKPNIKVIENVRSMKDKKLY